MNLHEYQSKHLLSEFKILVPAGEVVDTPLHAIEVAKKLNGHRWVVKAQVHAGGRGKAGGVKIVDNLEDLERLAKKLLGTRLVTHQTDERGQPINLLYIEKPSAIKKELYFSALVDRSSQRVIFMASTEGGMEIEQVAEESPEKILKVVIDPVVGFQAYQARQLFFGLNLDIDLLRQFTQMTESIYECFIKNDLSLLEINPLVITEDNQLICLDAKINIDDNALYRQVKLKELRDTSQEDERETRAQQWDLNYIALDGDIGCMVNGAGLAMATMDLIKLQGGRPANFLDVGGSATQERVTEAFKIIVSDRNVHGIFVNIFGGIVRCDLIATGIINAVNEVGVSVPVVVRLQGNNADKGSKLLADSGLNILAVQNFSDAAKKIVSLVKEKE